MSRTAALRRVCILGLLAVLAGPVVEAQESEPMPGPFFMKALKEWRKGRVASLVSEDGWLTLVGLYWLEPGENSIGTDPGSRVVLPEAKAPRQAGALVLEGGKVRARLVAGSGITVEGKPFVEGEARTDENGAPDVFRVGTVSFYVIRRGERFGVRVKDSKSPVRSSFPGIEYYRADSSYRILAHYVPYDPPKEVEIPSVLGTTEIERCPGYAEFEIEGKTVRLEPIVEGNSRGNLFFIFKDATSGKGSYPGGRFLYADSPSSDRVVLDFNRAFNPPCAFTPYATCPLPPKQNWLPVKIEAGERWKGSELESSIEHGKPQESD